jgi:hypothetical protein
VAEYGEAGGVGKCAPEGRVCLPVYRCMNYIAVEELGFKDFEDVQYS